MGSVMTVKRPGADEHAPYYGKYVSQVPDGADPIALLTSQAAAVAKVLAAVPREKEGFRYAPEKWSVREVIGHLADAERVFAYRMLRIGRADPTPLASFDENVFVQNANFEQQRLADLAAEFAAVRAATVSLARSFDAARWERRGTASDKTVSTRALLYIILGHTVHHMTILKERYGVG